MHCLRCRPYIHRSLISHRIARFNSTEPQSITFGDSSRILPKPTVIPSTERIENRGNLSSRLRQTTHHATTPLQPEPTPGPTPVARKDLIAAQRRAERLSREASLLGPVAGVVSSPSPPLRTPRTDPVIVQGRAGQEACNVPESVARVVPSPSPLPRTPRDDPGIALRRAVREARKTSEPVAEVAIIPPASPPPRTTRSDAAIAQRRAERKTHMLSESVTETAEVVPLTSRLPRASRNNAALAQRRVEREAREVTENSNITTSGRSTGDAKQRSSSVATINDGRAKNNLSPLETEDTMNLGSVGIETPQFRGAEEVSADLTDIFGDIPTSPSTGLTAFAPKVQSTKYTKDYLLRRFGGDYTHYISGPSSVYTTTPDKLGAMKHAAHILSRRQDVPIHLRQDALKIIQHATR
ncbi:hypothetical protein K443DRAFT_87440 [Laccaria amethystina LaAM-08-1]|uniref:Unplaced genomic scaffold K443scaffold_13, whole genome shotgun sequence n=1 Tax=Laccaria amethystina LaAM-08-1 TaxID=1095629 RepID=A0A0C9XQE6_9AGAR|nr:hypothetical protein K443DRAFT_87440 [Laccaria amethystina LaAM-08-1]